MSVFPQAWRRLRPLWIIVGFAVAVSVVFLAILPDGLRENEASDYFTFYGPLAQNVVAGNGLVMNGRLPVRYPPGFPVFLAAEFFVADQLGIPRPTVLILVNVVLSVLSSVLVFWVARLICTERIGLIAALLWASYPFNLWLLKQPNSEVPFITGFYLALWLFFLGFRNPTPVRFGVVGLLLGVATLIRPVGVFIPIILSTLLLWDRRTRLSKRLLHAGVLTGVFVLTLLPWEAAVYSYNRERVFLSTGASHGMLDGLTFPRNFDKGRRTRTWLPAGAQDLAQRIYEHQPPLQSSGEVARYLAEESRRDPPAVAEMVILKAARSWYGTDALTFELPIAAIQAVYLLLIIFGVRPIWRRFPENRFLISAVLLVVLYFWGMTVLVLSILRYMVPAMGLFLIFGAAALDKALSPRLFREVS